MVSKISASRAEEYAEERLIVGLFTGSLLQHKDLLGMLEDLDVRYPWQRTLLHLGVGLGKVDWVEELLARGSDPDIMDDSEQNALSLAEEMVRQFPDDVERSKILKLVTLVHRRDQVILRRLEASSSRSTDHATPVASPKFDIASIRSSVDSLRQEMKSLVRQLRSSLEELKAQLCGLDTLLRCLEKAVTSTVEDVTSIKCGVIGEASLSQPTSDPARARQECVDAMMRKTRIVHGSGVDEMRRLYERLYDEDECTACIIKFLSGDDRAKVMVDLESEYIGRMKETVVELDGTRSNGSKWISFCDLESETVYLGAKECPGDRETVVCFMLAWDLSKLSLKLVFDNEGRPYSKGDVEREREWMRALGELEVRRKRGEGLSWGIKYALDGKTLKARVCCLAVVVPHIIAYYGSAEGRARVKKQAPLLLPLYLSNVMQKLLAITKR